VIRDALRKEAGIANEMKLKEGSAALIQEAEARTAKFSHKSYRADQRRQKRKLSNSQKTVGDQIVEEVKNFPKPYQSKERQ